MTGSRPIPPAPAAQASAPLLGPLVLFTLALAFAGQILLIALQLAVPSLAPAGPPQLLDFQVFHIAGQLAWAGDLATAYDPVQFWAHTRALTGSPDRMLWPYPPHFNLVTAPLALLPLSWLACSAGIIIRAAPRPALAIVPVLLLCALLLALARRPPAGTESH